MKTCGKCKKEKDISCFSFRNKLKGTYSNECKDCHNEYRKIHYDTNTVVEKQRSRQAKQRKLAWYKDLKTSLVCKECGENHPATLQFHHLDSKTKDFNIANAMRRNLGKSAILAEIKKCIVLCANCHAKLHYNAGMM